MNATARALLLRPVLEADYAADLMTPNPLSLREHLLVKEAAAIFTEKGFSAAPVINEAGHPIGVLSRADIVQYESERTDLVTPVERRELAPLRMKNGELLEENFQVERTDHTEIGAIMTPLVYTVPSDAPAMQVVDELVNRRVHRLFVVDDDGVLVGVISAMDVLRMLRSG
jgi:CBS domain-containing protein